MARFDRLTVLNTMLDVGLVPVFYHPDADVTYKVAATCADAGATLFEFTNRGEGAIHVFSEVYASLKESYPHIILGVGSIVDAPTAALYIASGANFIVGPNLNPEVALICNRRKIAYSPGCGSVSEISEAEALGVEICKVFPGSQVGGPSFINAVKGPMPWSRLMPTGGVDATAESIKSWIKGGAACLGIGSKLIPKDLLKAGDYEAIGQIVAQVLTWIKEARDESTI